MDGSNADEPGNSGSLIFADLRYRELREQYELVREMLDDGVATFDVPDVEILMEMIELLEEEIEGRW